MENIESLVLEQLRAIRSDIGNIRDDMKEVKNRLANLEVGLSSIIQKMIALPVL